MLIRVVVQFILYLCDSHVLLACFTRKSNAKHRYISRYHELNFTNFINRTYKHFFSNRIINSWNQLPQYLIDADTTNSFKNRLDNYWSIIGYGYTQRPSAYY